MSAAAAQLRPVAQPTRPIRQRDARPVITGVPSIEVVATPAPVRGFILSVIIGIGVVIAALTTAFWLNARMTADAYAIQDVNRAINEAAARESTLIDEVIDASTPQQLRASAKELGLVPATAIMHVDLATGQVTAPAGK